jgi:hypothetical protein
MLTKNILGLTIALICIVAFIMFYTRLTSFGNNPESENAKNVLDTILARANALENGQSNSFAIRGLDGWFLAGWSKDVSPKEKPQKCLLESCVCICQGKFIEVSQKDGVFLVEKHSNEEVVSKCQEAGFCRDLNKNFFTITSPIDHLNINNYNRDSFTEAYIPLSSNLLEIIISKDISSLKFTGPKLSYVSGQPGGPIYG